MIYTLPDELLTRLAKACVSYRQAAAGLKKKVRLPLFRMRVLLCVCVCVCTAT